MRRKRRDTTGTTRRPSKVPRADTTLPRTTAFDTAADCAQWFDAQHEKMTPKLTKLERGDPLLPSLWDTLRIGKGKTTGTGTKSSATTESLETALSLKLGDEKAVLQEPLAVVICRQSLRVCEVYKALSAKGLACVKLFSKHMKVKAQAELLRKKPVQIVVGTPARLLRLVDSGALRLDRVKWVVYDMSKDVKQFDLLSMPAVAQDVFKLVRQHLSGCKAAKHVMW